MSDYEFVKVNDHKAHTLIQITDMDKFGTSLVSDDAREIEKKINAKILFILSILLNK